jgi:Xaa-Pro aminopeptidase
VALLDGDSDKPYTLLVRPRDLKKEAWNGPRLGVEGAKKMGADQASDFPEADRTLQEALNKAQRIVLICNFDEPFSKQVLEVVYPPGSANRRGRHIAKALVDGRDLVGELRLHKQPIEIEMLQKAVDASIEGHLSALRASAVATNEGHLAAAFEGTVRGLGARFLGYDTIAGAGNDACILHYPFADAPLQSGSLMLLDAGAEVGFYTADITRTWPLSGRFSKEQLALYELVLKAQDAGIALCRPGVPHIEGFRVAMRILSDGLVDLGILKGDKGEAFSKGDWKRFTFMAPAIGWGSMSMIRVATALPIPSTPEGVPADSRQAWCLPWSLESTSPKALKVWIASGMASGSASRTTSSLRQRVLAT